MQESKPNPPPVNSRRGFFFGAATVGAAAAAVTALPQLKAIDPIAAEVHPPVPERGGGYHLSEHVKRYYKTTRL